MLRVTDLLHTWRESMTEAPLIACASIVASPAFASANVAMGVCRGADDLRAILRARFTELGVSFETVDSVAGLPARYTAKVLGLQPTRNFGQISLDALLPTAAIMLIAVRDAEALARIQSRLVPLERVEAASKRRIIIKFTHDFMRKIGSLGGRKSAENRRARVSKRKALSEMKRQAALKRWQRATA
jgi:hypothetical protein